MSLVEVGSEKQETRRVRDITRLLATRRCRSTNGGQRRDSVIQGGQCSPFRSTQNSSLVEGEVSRSVTVRFLVARRA
jgi:hypothetical protein